MAGPALLPAWVGTPPLPPFWRKGGGGAHQNKQPTAAQRLNARLGELARTPREWALAAAPQPLDAEIAHLEAAQHSHTGRWRKDGAASDSMEVGVQGEGGASLGADPRRPP